jgi:hypothetical protein
VYEHIMWCMARTQVSIKRAAGGLCKRTHSVVREHIL